MSIFQEENFLTISLKVSLYNLFFECLRLDGVYYGVGALRVGWLMTLAE
jgi:hypothetical protein